MLARRAAAWPVRARTVRWHGGAVDRTAPKVTVSFVRRNGEIKQCAGHVGQDLLSVAHECEVELEGACEGSVACSTCHVILEPSVYSALPSASEDEEDMLDMAFGLTPTSRLGCQVKLMPNMDGAMIKLPKATRNFAVDKKIA